MELDTINYGSLWKTNSGGFFRWSLLGGWQLITGDFLAFSGKIDAESAITSQQVVEKVLNTSGAWNVICWKPDLQVLFVGRDIFGRESLVWSRDGDSIYIACSVPRDFEDFCSLPLSDWKEVPYGQLTEFSVAQRKGLLHSYFGSYPNEEDREWKDDLNLDTYFHNVSKVGMYQVNKEVVLDESHDVVSRLCELLGNAVHNLIPSDKTNVGVCFSGGVDSVLVAHVLLITLPVNISIQMVNVAFGESDEKCNEAPDRKRALRAFDHLLSCANGRKIELILSNVHKEELDECRKKHIAQAAAPCMSVLDDSLACVVWFALRGQGINSVTGSPEHCASSYMCMGSGADEVFAGYARHRNRYNIDGHASVAEECTAELYRLGARNGGRDARVAQQLNKKLICPFLDDTLVEWANALPVLAKCDLGLPRGQGEKRIIRLALEKFGAAHHEPKQAMQFGSRMAKMTNESKLVKGSNLSDHLMQSLS